MATKKAAANQNALSIFFAWRKPCIQYAPKIAKNVYPSGSVAKYGIAKIILRTLVKIFTAIIPSSGEIIYLVAQKPAKV